MDDLECVLSMEDLKFKYAKSALKIVAENDVATAAMAYRKQADEFRESDSDREFEEVVKLHPDLKNPKSLLSLTLEKLFADAAANENNPYHAKSREPNSLKFFADLAAEQLSKSISPILLNPSLWSATPSPAASPYTTTENSPLVVARPPNMPRGDRSRMLLTLREAGFIGSIREAERMSDDKLIPMYQQAQQQLEMQKLRRDVKKLERKLK